MFVTIHSQNANEFQTQHVTTTPVNMGELAQKQTQDMSAGVHGVAVLMTWQEPTVRLVRLAYYNLLTEFLSFSLFIVM